MLINKVTTGFVIQVFDTGLKRFVSQEFVAGDECQYEDKDGVPVCSEALETDGKAAYLPFDMVASPGPPDRPRRASGSSTTWTTEAATIPRSDGLPTSRWTPSVPSPAA